MARSLLREVTEPAVFGFDQWVAKDTLEMFGCENAKIVSRPFASVSHKSDQISRVLQK